MATVSPFISGDFERQYHVSPEKTTECTFQTSYNKKIIDLNMGLITKLISGIKTSVFDWKEQTETAGNKTNWEENKKTVTAELTEKEQISGN